MTSQQKARIWTLLPPELRREIRLSHAFLTGIAKSFQSQGHSHAADRYRFMRLQLELLFGAENIRLPEPPQQQPPETPKTSTQT